MSELPCSWYRCTRHTRVEVSRDEGYCREHAMRTADKAARSFVMERDRRICQRCGAGAHDMAHLIPRGASYVKYEPENVVALCRPCHLFVDTHPYQRTAWALERWPGRMERLWALEAKGERNGGHVDLAAVIRGFRERELTPEEMERYQSGRWLG